MFVNALQSGENDIDLVLSRLNIARKVLYFPTGLTYNPIETLGEVRVGTLVMNGRDHESLRTQMAEFFFDRATCRHNAVVGVESAVVCQPASGSLDRRRSQ